eukprot:jgi/Botrbrau1/17903/Bobra.50_1s0004.1
MSAMLSPTNVLARPGESLAESSRISGQKLAISKIAWVLFGFKECGHSAALRGAAGDAGLSRPWATRRWCGGSQGLKESRARGRSGPEGPLIYVVSDLLTRVLMSALLDIRGRSTNVGCASRRVARREHLQSLDGCGSNDLCNRNPPARGVPSEPASNLGPRGGRLFYVPVYTSCFSFPVHGWARLSLVLRTRKPSHADGDDGVGGKEVDSEPSALLEPEGAARTTSGCSLTMRALLGPPRDLQHLRHLLPLGPQGQEPDFQHGLLSGQLHHRAEHVMGSGRVPPHCRKPPLLRAQEEPPAGAGGEDGRGDRQISADRQRPVAADDPAVVPGRLPRQQGGEDRLRPRHPGTRSALRDRGQVVGAVQYHRGYGHRTARHLRGTPDALRLLPCAPRRWLEPPSRGLHPARLHPRLSNGQCGAHFRCPAGLVGLLHPHPGRTIWTRCRRYCRRYPKSVEKPCKKLSGRQWPKVTTESEDSIKKNLEAQGVLPPPDGSESSRGPEPRGTADAGTEGTQEAVSGRAHGLVSADPPREEGTLVGQEEPLGSRETVGTGFRSTSLELRGSAGGEESGAAQPGSERTRTRVVGRLRLGVGGRGREEEEEEDGAEEMEEDVPGEKRDSVSRAHPGEPAIKAEDLIDWMDNLGDQSAKPQISGKTSSKTGRTRLSRRSSDLPPGTDDSEPLGSGRRGKQPKDAGEDFLEGPLPGTGLSHDRERRHSRTLRDLSHGKHPGRAHTANDRPAHVTSKAAEASHTQGYGEFTLGESSMRDVGRGRSEETLRKDGESLQEIPPRITPRITSRITSRIWRAVGTHTQPAECGWGSHAVATAIASRNVPRGPAGRRRHGHDHILAVRPHSRHKISLQRRRTMKFPIAASPSSSPRNS